MRKLKVSSIILVFCLLPALAQEFDGTVRPWVIRVGVSSFWDLNDVFWVNSESQVGFADLSLGLELPCVGTADSEDFASLEESLIETLKAGTNSFSTDSYCDDEARISALISYSETEDGSQTLRADYSERPTCRQNQVPASLEQTIAQAIELGASLRDSCLATRKAP